MKFLFFSFLLCFSVCRSSPCANADEQRIEGQVFVATRGGENIKLGDVEVSAFPYSQVSDSVEKRRSESKALYDYLQPVIEAIKHPMEVARQAADEASKKHFSDYKNPQAAADYSNAQADADKLRSLHWDAEWAAIYARSGLFFLEKLHDPLTSTRTDADGNFSLTLPSAGKFVLAARANRKIGDTDETYCWLVAVEPTNGKLHLNLANANMTSSGNAQSLVQTVNSEDEALATAGRGGLDHLHEYADAETRKQNAAKQAAEAAEAERKAQYVRLHLPELVKQSQARALAKHPDLGKAGSAFNARFVEAYRKLQADKSPRLQEPGWPEQLADECAADPEIAGTRR